MNNPRMAAYLGLERQMLALDAVKDPLADVLRNAMDSLWYGLSDEEHTLLNNRTVLYSVDSALTIGESLLEEGVDEPAVTLMTGPLRIPQWQYA